MKEREKEVLSSLLVIRDITLTVFQSRNGATSLSKLSQGPEVIRVQLEIINTEQQVGPVFGLSHLLEADSIPAEELFFLER